MTSMVYCVVCIDPKADDVLHIFSTAEKRAQWAEADPRDHVFYDYALDVPERHEGKVQ